MLMLWEPISTPVLQAGSHGALVASVFSILWHKCSAISLRGPWGGLIWGQRMEGRPWGPRQEAAHVPGTSDARAPSSKRLPGPRPQSRVQLGKALAHTPLGRVSPCSALPETCKRGTRGCTSQGWCPSPLCLLHRVLGCCASRVFSVPLPFGYCSFTQKTVV